MKNKFSNIKGAQVLSRDSQRKINGGMPLSACPTGCFQFFLSDVEQTVCAVPGPNGEVCFGRIRNNQCCL